MAVFRVDMIVPGTNGMLACMASSVPHYCQSEKRCMMSWASTLERERLQFLAQGVGLVRSSRSGGGKAGGGRKGRESLGLATLGDLSPPSTRAAPAWLASCRRVGYQHWLLWLESAAA